jgi:hypothetical protein
MNYDNEEARNFEKKNAERLQRIRQLSAEDKQLIDQNLAFLEAEIKNLLAKPDRTEEENEILENISKQLPALLTAFQDMSLVLNHSLYVKSQSYYFHIKALAEKGDEKAMEIYKDLQPYYRATIKEKPESQN